MSYYGESGLGNNGGRSDFYPFYSLALKYSVSKDQAAEKMPYLTHTLLSGEFGGKLAVPAAEIPAVYKALAESFDRKANIPICEVLTKDEKFFRYFADIDFSFTRELTRGEIVQLSQTLQATVKRFFCQPAVTSSSSSKDTVATSSSSSSSVATTATTFDTFVLTTSEPPDEVPQLSSEPSSSSAPVRLVKTGIHLIMPKLWVTAEQCLTIRMSVLDDLRSNLYNGPWKGVIALDDTNGVEDQLDRAVYCEKIGLRMPYAVKFENCSFCKNNNAIKKTCPNCIGRGKLCVGRAYKLCVFIKSDGKDYGRELPASMRNPFFQMNHCTIRIAQTAEQIARTLEDKTDVFYCKPFNAPSDIPNDSRNSDGTRRLRYQKSHGGILPYVSPAKSNNTTTTKSREMDFIEVRDKTKRAAALSAVKEAYMELFNVSQNMDAVAIHSIRMQTMAKRYKHDKLGVYVNVRYYIITKGPYQHYCANLKPDPTPEHGSSNTRWIIDRCTIYQRCFSMKESSPKLLNPTIPCSKFTSKCITLSTRNAFDLFESESVATSQLAVAEHLYSSAIPAGMDCHFDVDTSPSSSSFESDTLHSSEGAAIQEELNKEYLDRVTHLGADAKRAILFFNKTSNELKLYLHKFNQIKSDSTQRPDKRRRYNTSNYK